jgi:hypothetical protein
MQPRLRLPDTDPAETTFPDACAVCGGDVHLRVVGGKATSYCSGCHWIAHPLLEVHHDGLHVQFSPQGKA